MFDVCWIISLNVIGNISFIYFELEQSSYHDFHVYTKYIHMHSFGCGLNFIVECENYMKIQQRLLFPSTEPNRIIWHEFDTRHINFVSSFRKENYYNHVKWSSNCMPPHRKSAWHFKRDAICPLQSPALCQVCSRYSHIRQRWTVICSFAHPLIHSKFKMWSSPK